MIPAGILATNLFLRVLNVITVVGINIFLTRLTGTDGYGMLSLLIANVTVFNLVTSLGIDGGITYNIANKQLTIGKVITIMPLVVFFQVVLVVIAELISYTLNGRLLLFPSDDTSMWWAGLLFLLSISITEKYTALFLGNQDYTLATKVLLLSNLLIALVFLVLFVSDAFTDPVYYIWIYIALSLLQSLLFVVAFHIIKKYDWKPSRLTKADIDVFFSYSLFAFVINLIQFLAYRIDIWILEYYRDTSEVGWYSLAVRLTQMIWVLPLMIAGLIFPSVAKGINREDEQKMLALLRALNFFNIIAGVVLYLIAPVIIPLFFSDEFYNTVALFRYLLPGVILFSIATMLAAYFAGKGRLMINFAGSVICLLVIIILDLLLIPGFGMKGAAIASSIGYAVTGFYYIVVYCFGTNTSALRLLIMKKKDLSYISTIFKRRPAE